MISTQIFCALPLSAQLVHESDPKYQFCNPFLLPLWDDVFMDVPEMEQMCCQIVFTRKYLLRGYFLGVLAHTTA